VRERLRRHQRAFEIARDAERDAARADAHVRDWGQLRDLCPKRVERRADRRRRKAIADRLRRFASQREHRGSAFSTSHTESPSGFNPSFDATVYP
jgi:hypothetical protein